MITTTSKAALSLFALTLIAIFCYLYLTKPTAAELDNAFANGSGITLSELSQQQQQNLAVLAKVWGFVKYYHPVAASGKVNMDAELFRLMPKVLQQDAGQRDNHLLNWIKQLGDYQICPECRAVNDNIILRQPDKFWHYWQLNLPLQQQLDSVAQSKPVRKHYWVKPASWVGNPEFHELDPAELPNLDAGYRLLALFRYWNIINYYFPYRDLLDKDWQQLLVNMIPVFTAAKSEPDYFKAMAQLLQATADTHSYLRAPAAIEDKVYGQYLLPFEIRFLDQQAVVFTSRPHDNPKGPKPGDIILSIGGRTIAELINEYSPLVAASNQSAALAEIAILLPRVIQQKTEVSWKSMQDTLTATLEAAPRNTIKRPRDYLLDINAPSYYRPVAAIGYVQLGKLSRSSVSDMMHEFSDTDGLIIDARNYPAEFIVHELAQHFFTAQTPFARFSKMQPNLPGSFALDEPVLTEKSTAKQHYQGKVILLVNEKTISQAEYTVMALQANPQATVIGSTTAAANGDVSMISLPGGMRTWISGNGVFYPDGSQTQRIGIVPDIVVRPSIESIRTGQDEVKQFAINWLQTQLGATAN